MFPFKRITLYSAALKKKTRIATTGKFYPFLSQSLRIVEAIAYFTQSPTGLVLFG